jgi:hypothetical protein
MKKFIRLTLAIVLSLSLNASELATSQKRSPRHEALIAYLQKVLGPRPSLRMFAQPQLPKSLFLRRHFAEVEIAGRPEIISYSVHLPGASPTTPYTYTVTTDPYSVFTSPTPLIIDGRSQDAFLVVRNTLGNPLRNVPRKV